MRNRRIDAVLLAGASWLSLTSWAHAAADSGAAVGEVVVTAPRQEVKARVVQKAAINLISVRAADTILKYPDFNAAEALGRMPGISLSSDTGEGRFVQIRGIDANLDGATYGGVPLLNTNPGGTAAGGGGRAVELDTVPTGAIDGIVVTYTLLPDHEAEGLGGSIELTPRSAANIDKPFVDATLGWGYEPLHDHTGPFEGDLAVGARFGFDDHGFILQGVNDQNATPLAGFISNPTPFSLVLYASRKDDRRAIDDLEESYIDDGLAPGNAVSQYSLRRYDYHRRRFSYGGDFEFEPNEDHRFYVRANVAGYDESVHKNILDLDNLNVVESSTGGIPPAPGDANGYLVTGTPDLQLTDEEEIHRNTIIAIGGVDRWNNVILDYHAAYSRATFHELRDLTAVFGGPTIPITYDNVSTPNYPIFTFPGGTNINDPSLYLLNSPTNPNTGLGNQYNVDADEEFSYAVNLQFPVHIFNDSDRIKVGAEVRLRDKTASEFDISYADTTPLFLSTAGFAGPALTYYNGHYTTGPEINMYAIRALALQSGPSVAFNQGSYIAAREDIFAAFAQYTASIGPWSFLAGARLEDTQAKYGGYIATTDADGNTIEAFDWRDDDYLNVFPTVQLRYNFSPTVLVRATYSTGIGRPGFVQNTTAASVDYSQSPGTAYITRGNPNLKPTLGQNFDLSFEDYFADGGILSLALFDKEFTNYIAQRIYDTTSDPLSPNFPAIISTWLNIPSGYARGLEADVHQKLVWLPKPLDGFGVEANLTLVDSRFLEYDAASLASVPVVSNPTNEYGALPGTSKVPWNLAGFYEAYNVQVRLAAEYVSHSLFGMGGAQALDTIQDSRLTLDLGSSYKIDRHWSVYFNAKNLLNTPLRYYEGSPDRPLQREFYDVTLEGGVKASF